MIYVYCKILKTVRLEILEFFIDTNSDETQMALCFSVNKILLNVYKQLNHSNERQGTYEYTFILIVVCEEIKFQSFS